MTELVRRAQAGDAEAFIALTEACNSSLYRIARGFLHEAADIDDALAETVLSCWENIGSLRSPAHFRTWLVRILINKCNDILRQHRHTVPYEYIQDTPCETSGGLERLDFEGLVNCLDTQYRAIFILYYSEGFRISEISRLLNIPQGTVGCRLNRGRKLLREILEKGGA